MFIPLPRSGYVGRHIISRGLPPAAIIHKRDFFAYSINCNIYRVN